MDENPGVGTAQVAESPWRRGEALAAARASLERRDFAAALEQFQIAAVETPDSLAVQLGLARVFNELGRPSDAEAAWRRVLEMEPNHAFARLRLGQAALRRRDPVEALGHLETAAAKDPKNLAIQCEMARALQALERPDEAEAIWRKVLEQEPGHAPAQLGLALLQWNQGRRSEALEYFQAAVARNPADPKLNLRLGAMLLEQWRSEEAEPLFRRVVEAEPRNVAALLGLGRCARMRGDPDDALASFRAAAAIEPDNQKIQSEINRLGSDQAAFDWRSEISAAAKVLRAAESTRDERSWAIQILLAYGVTDLVQEMATPQERSSPVTRRFLQAARQLDRLGLSQPAGALGESADPEGEALNALTGVVERLSPGAEALVLVFSGRLHRAFLSTDILHRILRTTGASLVYLRDLERTQYVNGVVGLGTGFAGTTEAFREIMQRSGARRLLTIGHCAGCAAALRFGLALGAQAVLGMAPRIGVASDRVLSERAAAERAARRNAAPETVADVQSLYLAAPVAPPVTLIGGADVEPDATFARDMAEKVPGVRFIGMPGAYSECLSEILARGLLTPLLSSFVADGAPAPDILEALSRLPPEDAGGGASGPAAMPVQAR